MTGEVKGELMVIGEQAEAAQEQLKMLEDGQDNLFQAVQAVEEIDIREQWEVSRTLYLQLFETARARSIGNLLSSDLLSPTQRTLVEEIVDVVDQIPVEDPIDRIERERREREEGKDFRALPRFSEHIGTIDDLNYAAYILTIVSSKENPDDKELAIIGRPLVTLSDTSYSRRDRTLGMAFDLGTITYGTKEGIVLGKGTEATRYADWLVAPELAPDELIQDYRDFMTEVTSHISNLRV